MEERTRWGMASPAYRDMGIGIRGGGYSPIPFA